MTKETKIITIAEEQNGMRVDEVISQELDLSRSVAKKLVENGEVTILGKTPKASAKVKTNQVYIAEIPAPVSTEVEAQDDIEFDIVFEDDMFAVIGKPQGLIVHPTSHDLTGTLVNGLLAKLDGLSGINGVLRPGIVHRIDKDTSGLLVVAKCDLAHRSLASQIEKKKAQRIYLAVCEGVFKKTEGIIETKIGRSRKDRKKMAVTEDGKIAVTHYNVLHQFDSHALVRFQLETGRTHQIRVHAKHIGHPVVGDKAYGIEKQRFNLQGQLLHATKLSLVHPETREVMDFCYPLPDYFLEVLKKLANIQGEKLDFENIHTTL